MREYDPTGGLLGISLAAMVPLRIAELADLTDDQRIALADGIPDAIAGHGDDLLYGGKHCAQTWAALVRALAIGAYQPGGITFGDLHWCAGPAGSCARAHAESRAIHTVLCACQPDRPVVTIDVAGARL